MTNKEFSNHNKIFKSSCKLLKIQPTIRQASKYRNKKGLAYNHKRLFSSTVNQEIINSMVIL